MVRIIYFFSKCYEACYEDIFYVVSCSVVVVFCGHDAIPIFPVLVVLIRLIAELLLFR